MEYQFNLDIPYVKADEAMEKLAAAGFFNTYYDQPIAVSRNENGYQYQIEETKNVRMHIISESVSPSETIQVISRLFNIESDAITYEKSILQDWQQPNPAIPITEEWEIISPEEDPSTKYSIILDSMGGFGTGSHETTRDCLKMILDKDFSDKTIIDVGTGSGVLSVAAAMKGAETVIALDIEPCEREVRLNAELNNIKVIQPDQKDLIQEKLKTPITIDWVFINIGSNETICIMEKQDFFDRKVNHFLISGIVEWSMDKLVDYFIANEYQLIDTIKSNEWVTMQFSIKP
ncbi:50S ribosomal protein L11 methyltransferase [Alkalihalobacillus sp. TS-13]|uniref:50S ribosomal protein L11 methyltransferase n=1 Tax=Alkalihalobacillus sp. TS-13 TaxID=2842455 RepID=UPI001C888C70|nr:50S ribosomal protein L11 methyltransferase [Alkalihalobacillus sp. TS-13]